MNRECTFNTDTIRNFSYSKCLTTSSPIFLEFLNENADKGRALERLAKYLGIKNDETMAIGDAGNDIPMIKKLILG